MACKLIPVAAVWALSLLIAGLTAMAAPPATQPSEAAEALATQPATPSDRPPTSHPVPTDHPCVKVITYAVPGTDPECLSRAVVIVPRAYLAEEQEGGPCRRWPVVYMLHGYGANYTRYWDMFSQAGKTLDTLADRYGLILVTPDGNRASWYLDAPADVPDAQNWQYETLITQVAIREVDNRYRTWSEPAGRGITGISMGGHGAMYLAARHPELFGACTSLSGVFKLTDTTNPRELAKRLGSLEENRLRWIEHNVLTQAEKFVGQSTAILFDCGWDDPFIADNRELHFKLMMLHVPHDYIERPGSHRPAYWTNALAYHLQFLADHLKPAGIPETD